MKRILLIAFILIGFLSKAQYITPFNNVNVKGASYLGTAGTTATDTTDWKLKSTTHETTIKDTLYIKNGDEGIGKVLSSDANGMAHWLLLSASAWLTEGNSIGDSTKFIGTIDNFPFKIRTNDIQRLQIGEEGSITTNATPVFQIIGDNSADGKNKELLQGPNLLRWQIDSTGISSTLAMTGKSAGINTILGTTTNGLVADQAKAAILTSDMTAFNINGMYTDLSGIHFLHLDLDTSGNTRQSIMTNAGQWGFNTLTPAAAVDIVGTLKITDGSEQNGYVLTSDASGNATWQPGGGGGGFWTDSTFGISNNNTSLNVGIDTVLQNNDTKLYVNGSFITSFSDSLQTSKMRYFDFPEIAEVQVERYISSFRSANFTTGSNASVECDSRGGYVKLNGFDGTSSGYVILQEAGGNVGIGTLSPTHTLELIGNLDVEANDGGGNNLQLLAEPSGNKWSAHYSDGSESELNLANTASEYRHKNGGSGAISVLYNNGDSIYTNNGAFYILHSGNVGIGTATPSQSLDINNGTTVMHWNSESDSLLFSESNDTVRINSNEPIKIGENSTIFSPNGDVVIHGNTNTTGTLNQFKLGATATSNIISDPDTRFLISYAVLTSGTGYYSNLQGNTDSLTFESGNANSGNFIRQSQNDNAIFYGSNITSNILKITASGNVGIGIATPSQSLEVVGNVKAHGYFAAISDVKVANYLITANDYTIQANGTFDVTLPSAVGIAGRIYNIKNIGVGTITLLPDGSETIDGAPSQSIARLVNLQVQSDGANWIVL